MRQILSRSLLTVAAASSVIAVTGGYANADSGAEGSVGGSPGVLSGDSVQAPVNVPVNVCGNTVDAAGALNPAFGNSCANVSHHSARAHGGGGASGHSEVTGSPGVGAGNSVDVPVHAPVNVCGNAIGIIQLLDPVFGNHCENVSDPSADGPRPPAHHPRTPPSEDGKPPETVTHRVLAETGVSGAAFGAAGAAAAALLFGGAFLYRRAPRPGGRAR